MYRTLIIGEHQVDGRGRIKLLGPDSLANFVPVVPTHGLYVNDVLCEDGVILQVCLDVAIPPAGFVCSYQVTAAHSMVKTYRPGIGDQALLIQEAMRRKLAVKMPSAAGLTLKSALGGCRCPIKNLMSTGHNAGCPEKKP